MVTILPDIKIKTPNLDEIFEKWKQRSVRQDKKKMEKQFGTKGAIFSLDAVSAAEYVKDTQKEAAIYFAIKKTVGAVPKGTEDKTVLAPKVPRETFYSFKGNLTLIRTNGKATRKFLHMKRYKQYPVKTVAVKGI